MRSLNHNKNLQRKKEISKKQSKKSVVKSGYEKGLHNESIRGSLNHNKILQRFYKNMDISGVLGDFSLTRIALVIPNAYLATDRLLPGTKAFLGLTEYG